jgi:hypothetical protein
MRLSEALYELFLKPESPKRLALFRMAVAFLLLVNAYLTHFHLLEYYGVNGIVSFNTARQMMGGARLNLFELFKDSDRIVVALFTVHVVACFAMLFGLFTRASILVVFVTLVSFHHRNSAILHSGDALIRIFVFYLCFSPAGHAYSLDNVLAKALGQSKNQAKYHIAITRLIQLQLCWVYLATGLSKSLGNMWADGTAVYYVTRLLDFQRFHMPWVVENLFLLKCLTWGTLVIELGFPILVWFEGLRIPVLICGFLFHLGVDLTMNIPLFQWTMIATYTLFITNEEWSRFF